VDFDNFSENQLEAEVVLPLSHMWVIRKTLDVWWKLSENPI